MKPDYSIQTLADIRKDDIHAVAESLMAYGVTAYHRGKAFDLSRFERPRTIPNGGTIWVHTGASRYEPPDPEHVIVLHDSLPPAWVKFISDGRVEENDEPDNTAPDPDKPKPPAPEKVITAAAKQGLTKQQVIASFDGLLFNSERWSKNLASPPKWLIECRLLRGSKSASALWSPVLIAAALHDKGIPMKKLDAVFIGLRAWAEEWHDVSAIFR